MRLIDCLQPLADCRLPRQRVGRLPIEDTAIDLWRFGVSPERVVAQLRAWKREGWQPKQILVSCGLSSWWQGARDLIAAVKAVCDAPITLGGVYPSFYADHAALHTAADHIVVAGSVAGPKVAAGLTLYQPGALPRFAGLHLLRPDGPLAFGAIPRDPKEVSEEVKAKAALGVTTFALFDDLLGTEHYQAVVDALNAIAHLRLPKVRFVTVGNVSPRLIDVDLAGLLRRAGFRQVNLHDDAVRTLSGTDYPTSEDDYTRCVRALHQAGFRLRTDEIGAAMVIGFPAEDLAAVTERLLTLASIVGSINLVPHQYTPGTADGLALERWLAQRNGHLDPTSLNAQLFPLARLAGATLEDYRELTRLAALLNSKYRNRTFDFKGASLSARLLRASLQSNGWKPVLTTPGVRGVLIPAGHAGPRDR